ncbi:unnamed protein product [Vitrella brassicaformis CCMP3155]|uniref:Serine/threonine-protein phosphatase n=2 Tax=Vitrella brassicaformis TaxID=1169539 RepID=A0A0G4ELM3_VITBC|nr:unnamed protein product [Vitrella brassicaformis CCMP3155]|mmetsp:Transcript_14170/g.33729  ORF Transcript_14170/g.33729 Transcript_14170/m.33729 type:complete len:709 (+) Transcript_14170:78-2204(+)|eukprot:CEL97728.1 unnamed protein product [Vitrella brassicaformis CCMP3155]
MASLKSPSSVGTDGIGGAPQVTVQRNWLQPGTFNQQEWGNWKSHTLLLRQSVERLNWEENREWCLCAWRAKSGRSGDAQMTCAEFEDLIADYPQCMSGSKSVHPGEPGGAARAFAFIDRNKDGQISEVDFLAGCIAMSPHTAQRDLSEPYSQLRLQLLFQNYDANLDGRLDKDELAALITDLYAVKGSHDTQKASACAATLHSHHGGDLTYSDFYRMVEQRNINGTPMLFRFAKDFAQAVCEKMGGVATAPPHPHPQSHPQPAETKTQPNEGVHHPSSPRCVAGTMPSDGGCGGGGMGRESVRLRGSPQQQEQQQQRGASHPYGEVDGNYDAIHDETNLPLRVVRTLMAASADGATSLDASAPFILCTSDEVKMLCDMVVPHLIHENTLVELSLPVRVYGDIHGNLPDLLTFFNTYAWPDRRRGDILTTNYLFLGDYVDRGAFSLEVVLLLFALKIQYPESVYLLRGNHEDRILNKSYGFGSECVRKLGASGDGLWELINDVFEFLPLAALVDGQIFAIHGGIGDSIGSVDDLRDLRKPINIPIPSNLHPASLEQRRILDALWSDPTDSEEHFGTIASQRGNNTCRFGPDRVMDFCERNQLKMVIRAHECVKYGYEWFARNRLLTVFSASNYCNAFANDAAAVVLRRDASTGRISTLFQVLWGGAVDTSNGWLGNQARPPTPMRGRPGPPQTEEDHHHAHAYETMNGA